jgi:hypothetical protein
MCKCGYLQDLCSRERLPVGTRTTLMWFTWAAFRDSKTASGGIKGGQ